MIAMDLDHGDVAVADRGNESGGVHLEEFGIVLDAGEKVDVPQPVRQSHFLEQPDHPEAPAFSETVIMALPHQ